MNIDNFVDIRLGCDGGIFHNLDSNELPNSINISYVDINGLFTFLNSEFGKIITQTTLNDKLKVVLFPTDSLTLSPEQYYTMCENLDFITHKNVIFYQSWYNAYLNLKPYCGSHIHRALYNFIWNNENKNIDLSTKQKHFLTLNNRWNLAREELYDFYKNLNNYDTNKFHCSFNFKDLYLADIRDTDDLYGDNVVKFYDDSLIEIITESHYDSITEKSYKPIIAGIPFIYWGIDDNYKVNDNYSDQINYFKLLDIDVNYFDINYNNMKSVKDKVVEILGLSTEQLLNEYKSAFEKAEQNKIKIIKYLSETEYVLKNNKI
jgi:hypothetical protein